MPRYSHQRAHLADAFDRFLLLLRSHCWRRLQSDVVRPQLPGLHISHAEASDLLAQPLNPFATKSHTSLLSVEESDPVLLMQAWQNMDVLLKKHHVEAAVPLRWQLLRDAFDLNPFEEQAIFFAFAPEVNPAIGRLFAFCLGEATKTRPTVGLLLDWLALDIAGWGPARVHFDKTSPLFAFHLLEPLPAGTPLLDRPLQLSERVTRFLLEVDELATEVQPFAKLHRPMPAYYDFAHALLDVMTPGRATQFIYLHGSYGSGRLQLAQQLCSAQHRALIQVNTNYLRRDPAGFYNHFSLLKREARLQNASLYLEDFYDSGSEGEFDITQRLITELATSQNPVFLAGDQAWQPQGSLSQHEFFAWACPTPSATERQHLWGAAVDQEQLSPSVDLAELAGRFRFTPGRISDVWQVALNQARLHQPANPTVNTADLYRAAHSQSVHQLGKMAQLIEPVHTWEDIVLPPEPLEQLHEIANRAKYLHQVYDQWGFGNKLSTNRGIVALFTGPSGTGKTMAASIVARELGLEMYRIDLSAVVSKYVGETEKNLSKIFDEAWRGNAIIFFDEADALFGKRSEVRDSHDRYANIEVNYLLQRIDAYDGIAILATNLGQNMDDAFQRRLQFTVNFPEADEKSRLGIWRTIWPSQTPLDPDVDFEFLAKQFKFNGGNIRNIALQAAFLAAPQGKTVTMHHVLLAVLAEIRKSGKLVSPRDFGDYAEELSLE